MNRIDDYAFSHLTRYENLSYILKDKFIIPSKITKHINYAELDSTFFSFLTPSNPFYITDLNLADCILIFDPIIYYKYKGILSSGWNFGEGEGISYKEPKEIKNLPLNEKLKLNLNYADIYINEESYFSILTILRNQNISNEFVVKGKVSLKYLKYIIVPDSKLEDSKLRFESYKASFLGFSELKDENLSLSSKSKFSYINLDYLYNDYDKFNELYNKLIFGADSSEI